MKDVTQDMENETPCDECEEESPEVEETPQVIIGNITNTAFDLNDIY
jgi:hypothetical protein